MQSVVLDNGIALRVGCCPQRLWLDQFHYYSLFAQS